MAATRRCLSDGKTASWRSHSTSKRDRTKYPAEGQSWQVGEPAVTDNQRI